MENTESTALVPFKTEEFVAIINSAPQILATNEGFRDAIVKEGNRLLGIADTNGMSDDLDTLMAERQGRIRNRFKECNEARKPITQLLSEISKRFTSIESDIDPASKTNVFFQIQQKRNAWATKKMKEQKEKERIAQAKILKDKEAISIVEQSNIALGSFATNLIKESKEDAYKVFESLNMENVKWTENINNIPDKITVDVFPIYIPTSIIATYHTAEEKQAIFNNQKTPELLQILIDNFNSEMKTYKKELLDKLPSKMQELEEIAEAKRKADEEAAERQKAIEAAKLRDAEEAERLQAKADEAKRISDAEEAERLKAIEERKSEEAARLQDEANIANEESRVNAAVESASQMAEAAVSAQADLFNEAPKVKEAYEIVITNKAGYSLIFQFWFEKEGKTLTADKIEKKSIGQMKKFCEDYAIKNDEKINSPLLSYKEIYKAK